MMTDTRQYTTKRFELDEDDRQLLINALYLAKEEWVKLALDSASNADTLLAKYYRRYADRVEALRIRLESADAIRVGQEEA